MNTNPSTGYSWQWSNRKMVAIVDTTKKVYLASNKGLVGSGGEEIWTFKGLKPGIDSVLLTYSRSWEKNPPAILKKVIIKVL